jgi:uncharacterized membrane protein (UPF0127 family)
VRAELAIRGARRCLMAFVFLAGPTGCELGANTDPGAPSRPETLRVVIAGEPFELELALDPSTRHRGLGGRRTIDRSGGMLFAFPRAFPQQFVMRDCLVPIDIAFLDSEGRVVAIHEMQTEPPRGENENDAAYESRLRVYRSAFPAQFALETAGGRLRDVGLLVGQRIAIDVRALAQRSR